MHQRQAVHPEDPQSVGVELQPAVGQQHRLGPHRERDVDALVQRSRLDDFTAVDAHPESLDRRAWIVEGVLVEEGRDALAVQCDRPARGADVKGGRLVEPWNRARRRRHDLPAQ